MDIGFFFLSCCLMIALGYLMAMGKVKKIDKEVYKKVWASNREGWNAFLDELKAKTKEDKIKELEDEIAELKTE